MNKKPVVAFTIADKNNEKYANELLNSIRKFHSEEELPFYILKGEELDRYLKDDPKFFYRATPILGERFLKEYELAVKVDADSLVLDDISYVWKTKDYDVGCVLNWNRFDIQYFPILQGWGILPIEYVNCGFVAMRNVDLVHKWRVWCESPQFDRCQYKEQDGLNIRVYHDNYNCRIFDHGDGPAGMYGAWGLFGKGEWNRTELIGDKIVIPKGLGSTPFPPKDMEVKIAHLGGGNQKLQWGALFPEPVMKRINYLKSEEK
jgi:hypothetical protein